MRCKILSFITAKTILSFNWRMRRSTDNVGVLNTICYIHICLSRNDYIEGNLTKIRWQQDAEQTYLHIVFLVWKMEFERLRELSYILDAWRFVPLICVDSAFQGCLLVLWMCISDIFSRKLIFRNHTVIINWRINLNCWVWHGVSTDSESSDYKYYIFKYILHHICKHTEPKHLIWWTYNLCE